MMAYISRTEPHNMFLEVSSRALITTEIIFVMSNADILRKLNPHIVNPGRIKTTPADEIEL